MYQRFRQERRNENRFPVLQEVDIPILIQFRETEEIEGVLLDLSATGIGLITFVPLEAGNRINMTFQFGSLKFENIEGKIVWSRMYKQTYRIGIQFTKINAALTKKISAISDDFMDCEIKRKLGVTDICYPECGYYSFCSKRIKY